MRENFIDDVFVWPEALTEIIDSSFGFIIRLRPIDYYSLNDFLNGKVQFLSWKTLVDSCIALIEACYKYHYKGYCLNCMIPENIYINPKNGRVLIYGTENICPDGTEDQKPIGSVRFIAPEIITQEKPSWPSIKSDRYSLAVIIFLIVCRNHPLEGKRWMVSCLTDDYSRRLYGTEPLFIFDPYDNSNAPIRGVHTALNIWHLLPEYMKETFINAFSHEALTNPGSRLRDLDWINVFVRFRSDIVRCSCGNDVFVNDAKNIICDQCGKNIKIKAIIKLPEYTLPAIKGTNIYRCQLGVSNIDELLDPVGTVVQKKEDPDILGFKNLAGSSIKGMTASGKEKTLNDDGVVPIIKGIKIFPFGKEIEFNEPVLKCSFCGSDILDYNDNEWITECPNCKKLVLPNIYEGARHCSLIASWHTSWSYWSEENPCHTVYIGKTSGRYGVELWNGNDEDHMFGKSYEIDKDVFDRFVKYFLAVDLKRIIKEHAKYGCDVDIFDASQDYRITVAFDDGRKIVFEVSNPNFEMELDYRQILVDKNGVDISESKLSHILDSSKKKETVEKKDVQNDCDGDW